MENTEKKLSFPNTVRTVSRGVDSLAQSHLCASPANDTTSHLDELVSKAALGDRRAIGEVARTFGKNLLAIARRQTGNVEDAEDVVQDVYLRLLEGRAAHFPPDEGRAVAWLSGLVSAAARSYRLHRKGDP